MPALDNLVDFGIKALTSKGGKLAAGIGLGYMFTPKNWRPQHPIRTPLMFGAGLASGGGLFSSAMMAGGGVAQSVTGMNLDALWPSMKDNLLRPALGEGLFPDGYMPEWQWGMSQMSHENLNQRYGGPNPNPDSALFVNNFNNSTGVYDGPGPAGVVGRSLGATSSAMNLGANGSVVFGLWNNRLKG